MMSGHNWTPPGTYVGRGIEFRTFIAPHLQVWEVLCRCPAGCGNHGMHVELLLAWSALRNGMAMPIDVLSGFRCPNHPNEKRKSRPGLHAQGRALDLAWPGKTLQQMQQFVELACRVFKKGGVGLYRWGLHVDIPELSAEPRRWIDQEAREADGGIYERLEVILLRSGNG